MEITFGNCFAQVTAADKLEKIILTKMRGEFSALSPGAVFTPQYQIYRKSWKLPPGDPKRGRIGWNGRAYLFDRNWKFLAGLLPRVLEYLRIRGVNVRLLDNRDIQLSGFGNTNVNLRGYQRESVDALLQNSLLGTWWPRGVLEMATGGGKTNVAVALYQILGLRTLFVTHRKTLVNQAAERFEDFGEINVGRIGGGNKGVGDITVATVQTLSRILKKDPHFLFQFGQVFFDEAHLCAAKMSGATQFVKVAASMPNAFARWGLSATPFKKDKYSDWLLEGVTGPSIYVVKNAELINSGWLSDAEITILYSDVPDNAPNNWTQGYVEGVVLNHARTKRLVEELKISPKPALILVDRKLHGREIDRECSSNGLNSVYVDGSTPNEARESVISGLRNGVYDIVIACRIFDEGVDIPNLATVVLAGAGKSDIKNLQRIGRGLRRTDSKSHVKIIDFFDQYSQNKKFKLASRKRNTIHILEDHSRKRWKLWKEEGFKINFK